MSKCGAASRPTGDGTVGGTWVHRRRTPTPKSWSSEGPSRHPAQYPRPHPHIWLTSLFILHLAVPSSKLCLSRVSSLAQSPHSTREKLRTTGAKSLAQGHPGSSDGPSLKCSSQARPVLFALYQTVCSQILNCFLYFGLTYPLKNPN